MTLCFFDTLKPRKFQNPVKKNVAAIIVRWYVLLVPMFFMCHYYTNVVGVRCSFRLDGFARPQSVERAE